MPPEMTDHSDNLYNKPELIPIQPQLQQQPDLFLLDKSTTQGKDRLKYIDALPPPTTMQSNR